MAGCCRVCVEGSGGEGGKDGKGGGGNRRRGEGKGGMNYDQSGPKGVIIG